MFPAVNVSFPKTSEEYRPDALPVVIEIEIMSSWFSLSPDPGTPDGIRIPDTVPPGFIKRFIPVTRDVVESEWECLALSGGI